ncbi:MAG: DUF4864 domain-containing protein [Alphaproteobacteria bacterium]|nr:DUF4864 domain-containing protein [Alphaproteobacteria bacterium]
MAVRTHRLSFLLLALMGIGVVLSATMTSGPPAAQAGIADVPVPPVQERVIDAAAGQDLIRSHLDAMRSRNAEAAFVLTTPRSRDHYATAAAFLNDMRFAGRALYNSEDVTFLEHWQVGSSLLQKALINTRYGEEGVLVVFRLEESDNGSGWLIDSFSVLTLDADDSQAI